MAEEKKIQIQIEIDDITAQGVYSNMAFLTHSDSEFIIDFLFLQPTQGKGKVRSRIITSPSHAKMFLKALEDNISKYEKSFGPIKEPKQEGLKLGLN